MSERITRLFISAKTLLPAEDGQATTEYALVLALLVAGIAVAVGALTTDMGTWISNVSSSITKSIP